MKIRTGQCVGGPNDQRYLSHWKDDFAVMSPSMNPFDKEQKITGRYNFQEGVWKWIDEDL